MEDKTDLIRSQRDRNVDDNIKEIPTARIWRMIRKGTQRYRTWSYHSL